jgi:predicted glycosyltransferase involved in capsule biosynthesis
MTFAAYKGWSLPDGVFDDLDWKDESMMNLVDTLFDPPESNNWHFHSMLSPTKENFSFIPYSTAISRKSMEALSGIDERYCLGVGYEDADLVARVCNLGLDIVVVDTPFCVHQKHPPTEYNNNINHDFFYSLQRDFPDRIKAPINTVYNR